VFKVNKFFSDITLIDSIARRLMQKLHDELDYNDDGNVSLDEGAEVLLQNRFSIQGDSIKIVWE